MQFQKFENRYMIVLARGEKVMACLERFCDKEKIEGGSFYGLGAVDQAILATYDVPNKKYQEQKIYGVFEVTNLTGTIGMLDNKRIVHAHMTVADEQLLARGGHLVEARVSGTMEITVIPLDRLTKQHDQKTGLNVFHFDKGIT